MKKVKEFIIKNRYYLIAFLFMLIICSLAPLNGDDWPNYNPNTSMKFAIVNAIKSYMTYESRFVSRVLINILCYYKVIWNVLNAVAFTSIYWSLSKIFDLKKNNEFKALLLVLILIPCSMFGQVYSWITGSITYLFPVAIILTYFAYTYKVMDKFTVKNVPILLIANLICALFIDHCGPALVAINMFLIVKKYLDTKKINIMNIICLVFSIISVLLAYFAPGNANRLSNTPGFENLSLLGKVFENYDNFLDYIYAANPILAILMVISVSYMIYKFIKKNCILKYILLLLIWIIPIYSLIYHYDIYNPFVNYTASLDFYWKSETLLRSPFVYGYWTVISVLFIVSILYILKNNKDKYYYLVCLLIGLIPDMVMLLSPTWGFRTTYFTNIVLSALAIKLIFEIFDRENYDGLDLKVIVNIGYYFMIAYLIFVFAVIMHFDIVRYNNIAKQYNDGNRDIVIVACPIRYVWNYNPYMDFHNMSYKNVLFTQKVIKDKDVEITFSWLDSYWDVFKGE